MPVIQSILPIVVLLVLASLGGGTAAGRMLIGTVLPYLALGIFLAGVCWRVVLWAASPVPFRIPTTCGQQRSLPWIKSARLENPSTALGAAARVALEAFLFRSLFRNNRAELHHRRYVFGDSRLLWLAALSFHFSLLIILLRHLRLLVQQVPAPVVQLAALDGFFQVGLPHLYLTDLVLVVSLGYLLGRRYLNPMLQYISQASDYFAPLLLLAIAVSGILMRHVAKVDVVAVKRFAVGLATLHPVLPEGLGTIFFLHLFLVCGLAGYFPFSKLMHIGGVFLSPTRNLANNSRMKRHLNPWNYPVKTHPYHEWQEEFRDKLTMAGIPLDEASHGKTATAD